MSSRRRLEAYRLSVGVLAAAVLVTQLSAIHRATVDPVIVATLLVAGVLAIQFPLGIGANHKLAMDTAALFAAAILLPTPGAVLVAAGATCAGWTISALRKLAMSPVRPRLALVLPGILFNGAQNTLSVGSACAIRDLVQGPGPLGLHNPSTVWLIPLMALAMYGLNSALVAVAVGLHSGRSPLQLLVSTRQVAALQYAGLFLVGLVAAAGTATYPWMPLVMVLPAAIIYISLKRSLQLAEQTIHAVERMADVVDRRDPYTYQHSMRVAQYSVQIGRRLGLNPDQVRVLGLAARVHDLGKVGVPDAVLLKPGQLSPDEWTEMRRHPQIGYEILGEFAEYGRMRELVLTHHERYDGQGYPNGVEGRKLPLLAQIIPVADAFDAMTSARPYRQAMSVADAAAILERGAGVQWNPAVVAAALAALGPAARPAMQAVPSPA
ncbi:MAG TPA: HD-GYP domain-containing protein [Candidatus Dormibacteraeota bacterium]